MAPVAIAAGALLWSSAGAAVSNPRMIADRPAAHCQSPQWSPDGKQLAFEVYDPKADARETWIIKFDSSGRKASEREVSVGRVTAAALLGGKKPPVVDFAWAPDMNLISDPFVFSSRGPKKNFDLFADGSWLTSNPGNDGQPAWSPSGAYIAFTSQQRDSGDIMLMEPGGDGKPRQVTMWPNATEFAPQWAPKGKTLLFVRSQPRKGQDIGIVFDVTKPGTTTKMLTEWSGEETRPRWSPDGRQVAFYANKGNKNDKLFDLWVIGVDGSGAKKLAGDVVVDEAGPAWSPDGSTVFYVKRDFKRDNPVQWARVDGSGKGMLDTGTQLNADLAVYAAGPRQMMLAFKALGQKGSSDKTWERLYVVTFSMDDLVARK